MPDQSIGIAVIGCGLISQFHLKALRGVPEFHIKGVWDINLTKATEVSQCFGMRVYPSFEDILSDPEIQVIDICLPNGLHSQYGCRAAAAGKHVIVEKPIDITMENALRLIDSCHGANVKLAVILQNRFISSVMKVKQAVETGVLGKLISGEAAIKWYRDENYYQSSPWKGTKQLDGGGALINQSIHTIDLLLWLMGDVTALTSLVRTARHRIEVEDLAISLLEFKSGAVGNLTGSTALKPGFPERIELYGEKGSIVLEGSKIVRWQVDGYQEADYLDPVGASSASADPAAISFENHQRQFQAIAQGLIYNEPVPVCGEDAIRSLQLILNIYMADKKWLLNQ